MVLYARNDIQGHHSGATGHVHRRPLKGDGTPIPVWGIDCSACEAELHGHPAWSASRYKIPLSPDEEQEAADAKAAAEAALHQQQMLLAQTALINAAAARGAAPQDNPEDVAITSGDDSRAAPEDPAPAGSSGDYDALNKNDLKDLARSRGIPVSGTREDLIARLEEQDQER